MHYLHWVARAAHHHRPFASFTAAQAAWTHLNELFPDHLTAVLMPNHLHVLMPDRGAGALHADRLAGFLSGVSRRALRDTGIPIEWQTVPEAARIPDHKHLARQVRYVLLNPCRSKFCGDPMEWFWSTHREVVGAALDPSHRMERLKAALRLGGTVQAFQRELHRYVSSDPSVQVVGTPFPETRTDGSAEDVYPLSAVRDAAAAAVRAESVKDQARNVFLHLAGEQRWHSSRLLAEVCGVHPITVRRVLALPPPAELAAARVCLIDSRLRRSWTLGGSRPGDGMFQKRTFSA